MSRQTLIGFDGQSNSLSPYDAATAYPYITMAHFDEVAAYTPKAIGGTSFPTRGSTAPTRVDPLLTQYHLRSVLFSDGGPSDLGVDGQTAAQTIARALSYNTARRDAGWETIIGNTVPVGYLYAEGTENAERIAYNAAVVADPSVIGADAIMDWAGIPQLQDYNNPTYFSDGLHFTSAGAALVGDQAAAVLHALIPEIPYSP